MRWRSGHQRAVPLQCVAAGRSRWGAGTQRRRGGKRRRGVAAAGYAADTRAARRTRWPPRRGLCRASPAVCREQQQWWGAVCFSSSAIAWASSRRGAIQLCGKETRGHIQSTPVICFSHTDTPHVLESLLPLETGSKRCWKPESQTQLQPDTVATGGRAPPENRTEPTRRGGGLSLPPSPPQHPSPTPPQPEPSPPYPHPTGPGRELEHPSDKDGDGAWGGATREGRCRRKPIRRDGPDLLRDGAGILPVPAMRRRNGQHPCCTASSSGPRVAAAAPAREAAVKQALDVAAALTTAGKDLPSVEQWRRFRASASGALPAPTQREGAATCARMAATGYVPAPTRWARRRAPHRDAGGGSRDDQCQEGSKDDHVDSH